MRQARLLVVSILILSLYACSNSSILVRIPTIAASPTHEITLDETDTSVADAPVMLAETEIIPLTIPERISEASFEYSGLGWYGESLVLLPQYPAGKDFSREEKLFSIAKEDLLAAIEQPDYELPVKDVPIFNSDLRSKIKGFEGFESILFVDQTVYMTIESRAGEPMMGYLIRGEVQGDLESVTLDPESLVELEPFSSERNATFEAVTYWEGNLYLIYEHNSSQGEEPPLAYQFNRELEFVREILFPVLNYRVTDATISDAGGKFWVMNYLFPGDAHLAVDQDALILEYGEGASHADREPVERLVQLQIGDDEILRIDQSPIYLQLLDFNIARNWEGIVLLDDLGFILITDSFPGSLLGFFPILR